MPGADLDSDARDPPPRCCEDTRSRICADLQDQVNDKARLIWVHGQAGVGKSAIMRTLAEMVSPKTPCATLFLSHYSWPPRDDLEKVFPTLAYSLAAANGGYRKYIEERISLDPTFFLEKSPEQQFNQLFLIPFANRRVQTGLQRWVVLVDGLDECKNKGDDQRRIVDLLCNFILKHSEDTPFVWVIASRTDGDLLFELKEKFQDHAAKFWEREITISSDDDAIRDILQYLRTEFPKIQKKYSNPPPNHPSNWPSEGDLLKVAKASSGLFVFASTLTKYISADHPVSHQSTPIDKPVSRFSSILTLIDKCMHRPTIVPQGAFGLLDKLYTQIMADIPEEKLPAAKSLLGFFRLVDVVIIQRSLSKERVGLIGACNILGLLQDEAYDTLLKLHCVLTCPSPKTAQVGGIQFPDASFPDFLLDYSRSGNCYMDWDNALTRNYHVDLDKELTNIWQCYIEIIKGSCRSNLNLMNHGEVDIHWAPDDDDTLRDRLQKELLWRAQHGWVSLLMEYGHSQCASCPRPANGRRLDIDATTLVKAFQDIHPVLFSGDKFPVERFVDWLDNHTPKAVRDSMISQRFPLNELDTERLFRSLCARPWCRYATGAYVQDINIAAAVKGLDVSQWSHAKEALWTTSGSLSNLVMAVETGKTKCRQPCTVTVVGVEQSGLYAVIGPIAKSDYYRKAFYVFPYSAEYSKDRIM
ncbi:hypothetical protein P691DRAFT_712211 [Macrolepiota fuliginosa MF-IS2]|uniref:Nephrocystin 3-like N-terminal domain-containing protein n=1 Tax=Macrolepiota fuliginosa MF-IS2 TaxID=1400762 RepID=A0A9P5X6F0_9AGAR|nr:hypothetical protein P691DRAFT_712211 [Macrolepiota fuliginosa MF-IS2]